MDETSTNGRKDRGSWLGPLGLRNYRLFIVGLVVSNVGTWMQRVAQSWLVLQITNGNGSALGVTTGLQFLPVLLFAAWGGVVVDRYSRRSVLLLTQSAMGFLALALALLDLTHAVRVWQVDLLAFLLGLLNAFDNPARNALLGEIVGPEGLPHAVGLNSASFNLARITGPSLGGLLVSFAGTTTAFLINAVSYLAVVISLFLLRRQEMFLAPLARRARGQLREGLRYVVGHPELIVVLVVIGLINTFSLNFQITVALMARQALGLPASGYGVLFGAVGAGSIVGALVSARRGRPSLRVMLGAALVLGTLLVLSAASPGFWWLFVLLIAVGVASLTVSTSSNTMVQLAAPEDMRGRTMALYFLATSAGRPLGAPLLGYLGTSWGPRWAMAWSGTAAIAIAVAGAALANWWSRRVSHRSAGAAATSSP